MHKRVCVLRRAQWDRQTDQTLNVRTCHFGDRLVRGRDFEGRAIAYDPTAIRAAPEAAAEPGAQVINVRSLAGRLWYSAVLGPSLTTISQVEGRVAAAIGLLPGRGTVQLTHGGRVLHRTHCAAVLSSDDVIELVAVVHEDPKWPRSVDNRPMPYVRVCGENLAFDVEIVRVE